MTDEGKDTAAVFAEVSAGGGDPVSSSVASLKASNADL